jgi:hypothetical protein
MKVSSGRSLSRYGDRPYDCFEIIIRGEVIDGFRGNDEPGQNAAATFGITLET